MHNEETYVAKQGLWQKILVCKYRDSPKCPEVWGKFSTVLKCPNLDLSVKMLLKVWEDFC